MSAETQSNVTAYFDEQRASLRALVFPTSPQWIVNEMYVGLGIMITAAALWIVLFGLYLYYGNYWVIRYERGAFLRPNVRFWQPIWFLVTEAIWIPYYISLIRSNSSTVTEDWPTNMLALVGTLGVPLCLAGAFAAWNGILSVPTSVIVLRQKLPQNSVHHPVKRPSRYPFSHFRHFPFNLPPRLFNFGVPIYLVLLLMPSIPVSVYANDHRKKTVKLFNQIDSQLASFQVPSTELFLEFESEAEKAWKGLQNIYAIYAVWTVSSFIPYLWSTYKVWRVIRRQQAHLKMSTERLEKLEHMVSTIERMTNEELPTPNWELGSPRSQGDEVGQLSRGTEKEGSFWGEGEEGDETDADEERDFFEKGDFIANRKPPTNSPHKVESETCTLGSSQSQNTGLPYGDPPIPTLRVSPPQEARSSPPLSSPTSNFDKPLCVSIPRPSVSSNGQPSGLLPPQPAVFPPYHSPFVLHKTLPQLKLQVQISETNLQKKKLRWTVINFWLLSILATGIFGFFTAWCAFVGWGGVRNTGWSQSRFRNVHITWDLLAFTILHLVIALWLIYDAVWGSGNVNAEKDSGERWGHWEDDITDRRTSITGRFSHRNM